MSAIELREQGNGWRLTGYASVFDSPYRYADYEEVIRRGAFSQTLQSGPDVVLLVNHGQAGSGLPLARTTAGDLRLREDHVGLRVEADLNPADADAQLVRAKVRAGHAREMSFAFRVAGEHGQRWSADYLHRELLALDLDRGDVSVVTAGANPATTASVRGQQPPPLEERRERAEEIGLSVTGCTSGGLAIVAQKPAAAVTVPISPAEAELRQRISYVPLRQRETSVDLIELRRRFAVLQSKGTEDRLRALRRGGR